MTAYGKHPKGYCVKCAKGCSACSGKKPSRCTNCKSGFSLESYKCTKKVQCPPNCTECNKFGQCQRCKAGWFVKSGKCFQQAKCPDFCVQCNDLGRCLQCVSGWFVDNGMCYKKSECPANCIGCTNLGECLQCAAGWFVEDGMCTPKAACPVNCEECDNYGKCTKCRPPAWRPTVNNPSVYLWADVYGLTAAGTCDMCDPQGTYSDLCAACDGDYLTYCTRCEDRRYGDPMYADSFGQCNFCSFKCLACSNGSGTRLECDTDSNYYLDNLGGCTYYSPN